MTRLPETPPAPTVLDRLRVLALQLLPQHLLARGMYHLTRNQWRPWKNLLIRFLIRRYDIDLSDVEEAKRDRYPSFNAFFTRALKSDARPVDDSPDAITSPVDGRVSQAGTVRGGWLIQAKGHEYSLEALLAGDRLLAATFAEGSFATLYLSPRDYHRVHMPVSGRLTRMDFVPGELYSVNEATTQLVPGLFARNERAITLFETAHGPLAVILVGAIFVGSIETVWAGEIREAADAPTRWVYPAADAPYLEKGEEMGRFNMGSTVILLLSKNRAAWAPDLLAGRVVRLGERIGTLR